MTKKRNNRIKRQIQMCGLCLLIVLAGASCVEVREHLTIHPNGSGTLTLNVRAQRLPRMMNRIFDPKTTTNPLFAYPPLTMDALETLFPPDTFRNTPTPSEPRGRELAFGARLDFDDIHDLIASPYGRMKSLEIETLHETIRFSGHSGMAAVIYALTAEEMEGTLLSGRVRELLLAKRNELDYEFRLTLPGEIVAGNGTHKDKSGVWRIKAADLPETGRLRAAGQQPFQAECAADAIHFALRPQGSIGAWNFEDQKSYAFPTTRKIPSLELIREFGKFESRKLIVSRYFDVAGTNIPSNENICCLQGALLLPNDLAPKRLSWVKTTEVIDERGGGLLLNKEAKDSVYNCRSVSAPIQGDEGHTEFPVNFSFSAPDWGTWKLRLFRGEIGLAYVTTQELIKAADALPASWITTGQNHQRTYFDMSDRRISNSRLDEIGVRIQLLHASAIQDLLNLQFEVEKDLRNNGRLTGIQIYGPHGAPLPTYTLRREKGYHDKMMMEIVALGFNGGPLSMGMTVDMETDALTIPILLQDVTIIDG
jgi:hypothetical protein